MARAEATIGNATGTKITVTAAADAAGSTLEDFVFIDDAANSEWATVDSVAGTIINVKAPLTHNHTAGLCARIWRSTSSASASPL